MGWGARRPTVGSWKGGSSPSLGPRRPPPAAQPVVLDPFSFLRLGGVVGCSCFSGAGLLFLACMFVDLS